MKRSALTMFLAVVALAPFFCLGAAATAAEPSVLQMSIIPPDAQWVLHLDMEKFTSSALFKLLIEDGRGVDIQKNVGQFAEKFKMDPFKDIKGVTVFGRGGAGKEPVVAISGRFDKAQILGLLKADASTKETPYGKYTLYGWQDKHFGAFANDNLVLITENEADIKAALDAIEGKAKNVSVSPLAARLRKEPAGAIVEFAVADIAGVTGEGKGAVAASRMPAMLSQMKSVSGAISEIGDKLDLLINIGAESTQVANNVEQAIKGLIALGNLQSMGDEIQMFIQGISVKVDGQQVRINASYPVPELTKIIKEHKDRKAPEQETEKQ